MKTDTISAPGATLYYEVRGPGRGASLSGGRIGTVPTLLLICGGVYDAAGYAGLAAQLADRYTVVTYDRRGNSRSPLDGPPGPQSIAEHGEDARRILSAVGVSEERPAYVFGNSSGASIGLELVANHPELVRVLVAHEPPVFDLLDDRDRFAALMADVERTFAREGAGPAGMVFGAGMHMRGGGDDADPTQERIPGGAEKTEVDVDPELAAMMGRMQANMDFFIGYEVPPFGRYSPDLPALRAASTRIVPAVGADSTGEPPHRCGLVLAERLATEAAVFPGDHGGFGTDVQAFAATLDRVLLP